MLAASPKAFHKPFLEHERISLVSNRPINLHDEVKHYLGEKEQSIIRRDRRCRYGRLKVLIPEEYKASFVPLVEDSEGMAFVKPYRNLESIDQIKEAQRPLAVVLREEDRHRFNRASSDSLHIFQLVSRPS
jgi:hypothetical protein